MSRPFGPDYARGLLSEEAAALLPARFRTPAGRRDAVASARRGLGADARAALVASSASLPASPARARALEDLERDDVSVVVTGQQVGLFVGPLYSLWKAATAIALAERLAAEAGTPVVPVFWLQTEDHDLAEVAENGLSDPRGGVHVAQVDAEDGRPRVALAHRVLGADVEAACDHAAAVLAGLPYVDGVMARLRAAWRPGRLWADAFAQILGEVFPETPLLLVQPRSEHLAVASARVHRWALEHHEAIAAALTEQSERLEQAGYGVQVPPRPDCALSFFHPEGGDGPRYRLRRGGDGWLLADGTDRPVDVKGSLAEAPLRFSTSALLRPLLQDSVLPTAAYVGGPGELSYWAQLPPLYEEFGLPLPLVVPRATGVVVDAEAAAALEDLGISPSAVDAGVEELLERLGPPADAPDFGGLADRVRAAVEEALAEARASAATLDGSLDRHFERTCDSAARDAGKLEQRLQRVACRSDQERVGAVRRAVARLRPGGAPQDRSSCWPDLAARVGVDAVGPLILRAVAGALAEERWGEPLEVWS